MFYKEEWDYDDEPFDEKGHFYKTMTGLSKDDYIEQLEIDGHTDEEIKDKIQGIENEYEEYLDVERMKSVSLNTWYGVNW